MVIRLYILNNNSIKEPQHWVQEQGILHVSRPQKPNRLHKHDTACRCKEMLLIWSWPNTKAASKWECDGNAAAHFWGSLALSADTKITQTDPTKMLVPIGHCSNCKLQLQLLLPVFRNIKFILKTRWFPKWWCNRITAVARWHFTQELWHWGVARHCGAGLLTLCLAFWWSSYTQNVTPEAAWNQVVWNFQ